MSSSDDLNARITRNCVWSLVNPRIHKICPDLDPDNGVSCLDGLCSIPTPSCQVDIAIGDAGSAGGSFPTESASGMQLVGIVVTTCCQTNVPKPKKRHHAHCCNVRFVVENATLPNSTIII